MENANPIPKGYEDIIPHIFVKDSAAAIEFYTKVFDAVEEYRHSIPGDKNKGNKEKIVHAVINIGKSKIMLADEFPEMCDEYVKVGEKIGAPSTVGGNSVYLNMYFENVDDIFERAKMEGATVIMPLMDAFWGDRYGQFKDPFGHIWEVATHKKDMTKEELEDAAKGAFEKMGNVS
jgi:PhnB protein